MDGQWGAKKLSLLVDAPEHKTAHWQDLANFVRREHIPGVELRSVPWRQQQDLLRVLFPGRIKGDQKSQSVKVETNNVSFQQKLKQSTNLQRPRANPAALRAQLSSKTGVALKRELLSRNMSQMGTKPELVERLLQAFLEEDARHGIRWWSHVEAELNDFYQRVDQSQVPHVHKIVSQLAGDRNALNTLLADKFDGRTLDSIQNGHMDFRRLALLVTAASAARGPGAAQLDDYLRRDGLTRIDLGDQLSAPQRKAVLQVLQRAAEGSKRIAATEDALKSSPNLTDAALMGIRGPGTAAGNGSMLRGGANVPVVAATVVHAAVVKPHNPIGGTNLGKMPLPRQSRAGATNGSSSLPNRPGNSSGNSRPATSRTTIGASSERAAIGRLSTALKNWATPALKQELSARGAQTSGAKRDIVRRLAQLMFSEKQHSEYPGDFDAAATLAFTSKRGGSKAAVEAMKFATYSNWWSEIESELFEFYRTANPKNLSTVQSIVQSFKGDRRQLNEALVKKYRRSLLSRDEAARVMSSKVAAAPALKKTNPPASRGVVQKRPAPAPTSTTGAAARGGYGSTTFGAHGKPAAKKARVGATKQSSGSAGRGKGSASTASGNGKVTKAKAKSSAAAPGASGRKIKSLDRQSASARLEAILGAPPEPLLPMDELLKKLKKRSAVALKRELAARGCLSTGLKKDVVPRLAQVFFADAAANGARRGYAWWSEMEAELLDFFQRVDPAQVPNVRVNVTAARGDRAKLSRALLKKYGFGLPELKSVKPTAKKKKNPPASSRPGLVTTKMATYGSRTNMHAPVAPSASSAARYNRVDGLKHNLGRSGSGPLHSHPSHSLGTGPLFSDSRQRGLGHGYGGSSSRATPAAAMAAAAIAQRARQVPGRQRGGLSQGVAGLGGAHGFSHSNFPGSALRQNDTFGDLHSIGQHDARSRSTHSTSSNHGYGSLSALDAALGDVHSLPVSMLDSHQGHGLGLDQGLGGVSHLTRPHSRTQNSQPHYRAAEIGLRPANTPTASNSFAHSQGRHRRNNSADMQLSGLMGLGAEVGDHGGLGIDMGGLPLGSGASGSGGADMWEPDSLGINGGLPEVWAWNCFDTTCMCFLRLRISR
eukprot:INCI6270.1.p1 GENE.INCI6270.1~~INCI6270.1.p1  ORF type:complete len:1108 (-),score=163.50 INCI6270.1:242-3565(-)